LYQSTAMHEPIRYDRHLSATEQTHFVYGSAEPGRPTYPRKFTASMPHMINVGIGTWYNVTGLVDLCSWVWFYFQLLFEDEDPFCVSFSPIQGIPKMPLRTQIEHALFWEGPCLITCQGSTLSFVYCPTPTSDARMIYTRNPLRLRVNFSRKNWPLEP